MINDPNKFKLNSGSKLNFFVLLKFKLICFNLTLEYPPLLLFAALTMSAEDRKAENAQAVDVLNREVQSLDENAFPTLKAIGENGS